MDCLVLPCHLMKRRRRAGPGLGYGRLKESGGGGGDGAESPVTVVVGKERKVFLVEPFVLEENPFRVLMETQKSEAHHSDYDYDEWRRRRKRVIFVDVDAILFEHLLWLLYNDSPSLFNLDVEEILEFYALDC